MALRVHLPQIVRRRPGESLPRRRRGDIAPRQPFASDDPVDRPRGQRDAFGRQDRDHLGGGADASKALEHEADVGGLGPVHDQLTVPDVVAERRPAAHPHALLPGGSELIPYALADHLTLELGEGQQDVERQPAHRCRGVE